MRADIHPDYDITTITCACGATYRVASTQQNIRVEICANCHPFYTGKQRVVHAGGRVERFRRRYEAYKKHAGERAQSTAGADEQA